MHVSGLFLYPVKSLRGIAVEAANLDELGIVGDRRFLVVEPSGRFLTQRAYPRMALIETALTGSDLVLTAPDARQITISLHVAAGSAPLLTVSVWKSEGLQAEDCGEEPAAWLSSFLGVACRLVRIGAAFRRPVLKATGRPGDVVAFNDAFSFMAISQASLDDLNRRLGAEGEPAMPMDRFRPNFVIAGTEPYAEDTWPRIRIGQVVLRAGGPCSRCAITTTNQQTAERGREPLRLLSTYRRDPTDPKDVNFGQNFIHETKTGTLKVGDAVEVLR